ncbi:hypothetical protein GUJ93_ZPchr0458g22683 [Zizania palustris]|uniref:Uncharacterized protein n=1 Tax=Zizania palustris TaxID=103762 RepID=A0A8J5RED0_ZIZPA|nr:hypothetical protein GUJ93_ZPchr0458g22683 [Zizania palustris]
MHAMTEQGPDAFGAVSSGGGSSSSRAVTCDSPCLPSNARSICRYGVDPKRAVACADEEIEHEALGVSHGMAGQSEGDMARRVLAGPVDRAYAMR